MNELEINKITPYSFNSRAHSDQQIAHIAESIKQFGFNQPIVVDKDNTVIVGHGRLEAAKKLGLTKVPVIQKEALTEKQIKAYRILDNKLQNDSTWDFPNLGMDLEWLEQNGLKLEDWGLDQLKDLFPEPELEVSEDEFTACENTETLIRRGDLIELGKHRVMCGDSREHDYLEDHVDVLITDPPYGIGEHYLSYEDSPSALCDLIEGVIKPAITQIKRAAVTSGVTQMFLYPRPKWIGAWVNEAGTGMSPWGFCCWQPVLLYGNDPFLADGKGSRPDIFKGNVASEKNGHPCPKPLVVWADIIKRVSRERETILDLFLGSGTTLIACDQLNRICYGMEIEPKYCEIIIQRYKAHCAKAGKAFECKVNGQDYNPVEVGHASIQNA